MSLIMAKRKVCGVAEGDDSGEKTQNTGHYRRGAQNIGRRLLQIGEFHLYRSQISSNHTAKFCYLKFIMSLISLKVTEK